MRKLFGLLILAGMLLAVGFPAKASDPLQDCLNEVNDEFDIGMEWCNLAWPGEWGCINGVVQRSINDGVACHLKYDN